MRKSYYSLPLLFFFLAAGLGLFLRWQFIAPTPGIRYTFFLHSHSHVMFLGWVMNAIYLANIERHCTEKDKSFFLKYFVMLQIWVVAMMISFPIQGYGGFSIAFSTLHTLASMVFIAMFLKKTNKQASTSLWFARVAWIFFFVSTAGPFSLGFLMANGMGNTPWYNLSIYYYLHFQYNGFFFFGILSLFYQLLEQRKIAFNAVAARKFGLLTAIACIPAYVLSTLYLQPGTAFNILGAGAAILQLVAFFIFIKDGSAPWTTIRLNFSRTACRIFIFILVMWSCKLILQLFSAHPEIADWAYNLRPIVIAYLHMVLLGIITAFLLLWYLERRWVDPALASAALALLLIGFMGSQLALTLMPWWSSLVGVTISSPMVVFSFSILLFVGAGGYYAAAIVNDNSKRIKT